MKDISAGFQSRKEPSPNSQGRTPEKRDYIYDRHDGWVCCPVWNGTQERRVTEEKRAEESRREGKK